MKRTITLYIGGERADVSPDGLVLLNYAQSELTNPTIVRNSWSNDVTLPATPTNNRIFGASFRLDRDAGAGGTGPDFNASRKTTFTIYNSGGEIIMAGYCKLTAVNADGYRVQLFGGLGEFIYGLAYDADGNKKTLASLDYLGGGDTELDFVIDKTAVADAWARLGGDTSKPAMWDVVNFAPAYNGIPDKNFAADKALADPDDVGLADQSGDYGTSSGGNTLVTLAEKVDEWAAKDLRSYLQRPVLSMRAFLDAVCNPGNNEGWNVDATSVQSLFDLWLTRPLLPSLGTYKQEGGTITITPTPSGVTTLPLLLTYVLASVPAGAVVGFRASVRLQISNSGTAATLYGMRATTNTRRVKMSVALAQAVGYDSANVAIAASPVTLLTPRPITRIALKDFAEQGLGYAPVTIAGQRTEYREAYAMDWESVSAGVYRPEVDLSFELNAPDIAKVEILVTRYTITLDVWNDKVTDKSSGATLFSSILATATEYAESGGTASSQTATATTDGANALRSGALITKRMLLATERTPADYLLAMCKTFGLYILADAADKSVQILSRTDFYINKTTDLTERIHSQSVEIQPLTFDAKWYDFKMEGSGGAFENEYQQTEGVQYGIQRVNTGYDFDADAKNLLDGVALKACASVRGHGPYFYDVGDLEINTYTYTGQGTTTIMDKTMQAVTPGDVLRVTISNHISPVGAGYISMRVRFYDSSQNVVSTEIEVYGPGNANGSYVLTAPAGAAYFGFEGREASGQIITFVVKTGSFTPSPFLVAGGKQTLWNADGESLDLDISVPGTSATITGNGYDVTDRAEFRDGDGKPQNGADVLLLCRTIFGMPEFNTMNNYRITDDTAEMEVLAGGPCWILAPSASPLSVPRFSRYVIQTTFPDPLLPGVNTIREALDFGIPRQLDIPDINSYANTAPIYARRWQDYIRDRLSVHGKVLRCLVDLSGLQVGPELLRQFYWYRGALWALNKITNYSLTTYDPAECEFIQVQDIDNYV